MSWSEIFKVNSNLSTPLDETLGNKADTASVATTSSLFSWIKQIYTNISAINSSVSTINTYTSRGAVKSTQRGVAKNNTPYAAATPTATTSVTISAVNSAKCLVTITLMDSTYSGNNITIPFFSSLSSTALNVGGAYYAYVAPTNSIYYTGTQFAWQVIEFY